MKETKLDFEQIEKERQSKFELLRIISMLFIIIGHYILHSGICDLSFDSTFNKYVEFFLKPLANIGVNCFVLISGYFLINSKFKTKSLIKLIFETFFYSIVIMAIYYFTGTRQINIKETFITTFSGLYGTYWFITTYLILYLFFPFVNKMLDVDKKKHIFIIILFIILFCAIPTFTLAVNFENQLFYFITLYSIGAYIRKYGVPKLMKHKTITILLSIAIYILACIISLITKNMSANFLWCNRDSIFIVLSSILFFMFFYNIKIKNNKIINTIAGTTFAIYLIHEHPFNRDFIWKNFFHTDLFYNEWYFIIMVICTSIVIFIVCSLIDFIRKKITSYIKIKKLDEIYIKIDNIFNL